MDRGWRGREICTRQVAKVVKVVKVVKRVIGRKPQKGGKK